MTDSVSSASSGARPHRGVLILVLGILGLVVCMPLGIAAWVMGSSDLKAMNRGEIDPDGRSMTQAGKVCGIISVVWVGLVLLAVLGMVIIGLVAGATAN